MKYTIHIIALAILLAVSCQRNELPEENSHKGTEKILTVGVVDESDTRVGFDENNSFYWHKGDKIGVLTSSGFREMTLLDNYHKKPSGVFVGNFQEEIGEYVVFPYGNHMMENGVLTFVLPSSYTYTSIEADTNSFNPPMLGKIDGPNAQLRHLGSFFKISVTNIPAGGEDMKMVFSADKRITGGFNADPFAETPVINTDDSEGNTVTIYFSNTVSGGSGTFYIPAPLGTYGSVGVEIFDGDISIDSKTWTDQVVTRMTPKRGAVELNYIATINELPFGSLQDAINAADNNTVTLVSDIVLDTPLEVSSGKSVVLDLNGKTITETATSASASYLMSVKSGGELTIKNGTISFAATTPDTMWGGEGQPPYPGYANNTITNQGTLILENTTIENKTSKGGASYVIDNYAGANLIINEGTVLTQSGGDIAIRMFNGGSGAINVTINGGTITGYRAVWIQLASNNTAISPIMNLTVNGGTLTSIEQTYNQAVYSYSYGNDMQNVLINVTGGTFNGDIALTGGSNKTNLETLNISGGTFNGQWGFYSYGADEKALNAITVTGGTFMTDPTYYLDAGYNAVESEGKWTVVPAE
jgi:hypothetical protein